MAAQSVVICGAARTPQGSLGGSLASLTAPELGGIVIKAVLERTKVDPALVDEVYMGNVLSAGIGQAPARQAALAGGLPNSVPCTQVNKVCASGMKAVMLAYQAIASGSASIVVAGGMESMSNAPYYLKKARTGFRLGHQEVLDAIVHDGLTDAYSHEHMGLAAELCAEEHGISREEQDKYTVQSYTRAGDAHANGHFASEIVPVTIKGVRGAPDVVVTEDEEIKKCKMDKIPTLRTVFKKDGTVTAGNASSINDGAAALVIASEAKAKELGLPILAKIRGIADAAQEPERFTTAPALAIPKAISRAGLSPADIDFYEINEAFSVVACANMKLLSLDPTKVNIYGGGVSIGHPIGCSGARILVTLLSALKNNSAKIGCAGVCNGGGGASAVVVELQ